MRWFTESPVSFSSEGSPFNPKRSQQKWWAVKWLQNHGRDELIDCLMQNKLEQPSDISFRFTNTWIALVNHVGVLQLVIHVVAFSETMIFSKLDSRSVQHGINITLCVIRALKFVSHRKTLSKSVRLWRECDSAVSPRSQSTEVLALICMISTVKNRAHSQNCWQILLSLFTIPWAEIMLFFSFSPLSAIKLFSVFLSISLCITGTAAGIFELSGASTEQKAWFEETQKATKNKRDKAIKLFRERREWRKKRDNGEKKDSDHADYGRTQQTGKTHQSVII